MAFDWLRFLEQNNIEFVTSGPNVSRGNVAVHCPWCGHDDPSQHLSVSIDGKGYACWRKPDHRGKNPTRLVMALLNCSFEHAASITGSSVVTSDNFLAQVQSTLEPTPPIARHGLKLPKEFRPFFIGKRITSVTRPFFNYLKTRGFERFEELTRRYGVYFATLGPFKGRIIFSVYADSELVSWTGRTIYPSVIPRYLALTTDEKAAHGKGLQPAVGPLPNYLLWYDRLKKLSADTIYICEGPFDALRVSVLGRRHGICATCLFTSSPTKSQIEYLHELLPRFKNKFVLLDQGTLPTAMKMAGDLSGLGVVVKLLPTAVKDPGELSEAQLLDLTRRNPGSLISNKHLDSHPRSS